MAKRIWSEAARRATSDPKDYSPITSSTRMASLSFAIAGCANMLLRQKNTRIMALATVVAIGIALWLELETTAFAILILAIAIVWITEFLNAAIEACVNLATPKYHPMARLAKDISAGATLVAVVAATIVGALTILSPLAAKLAEI